MTAQKKNEAGVPLLMFSQRKFFLIVNCFKIVLQIYEENLKIQIKNNKFVKSN